MECDYCHYGTPEEGNCPAAWIGAADGCDCGCQSVDPDCSGTTGGPPPPATCGTECDYCWFGTTYENLCDPGWNGTADGCDCGCQFTDPDCGP